MNEIKEAIETLERYGLEKFVDNEWTTLILIGISEGCFEEKYNKLCGTYSEHNYDYNNFYEELKFILLEEKQYFIILN